MRYCPKCDMEKDLDAFYTGKKQIYSWCKECSNRYCRERYSRKREEDLARMRAWQDKNQDHLKEWRKQYNAKNKDAAAKYKRERHASNGLVRLMASMRRNTSQSIRRWGKKSSKTLDIAGCTVEQLMAHLQAQFQPGMTWENYGEWHIDHIIPLSSATSEQDVLKLCNYLNLQPLWAADNIRKGNRIESNLRINQKER